MRLALLAAFLFAASSAVGQNGAQLVVSAPGNTFRLGERIPLSLNFTAPEAEHLYLAGGTELHRDYRGPLVSVTPVAGWVDPRGSVVMDGGFSGMVPMPVELSQKPTVRSADLNEWVRFEQPGDYTVVIRTTGKDGLSLGSFKFAGEMQSNPVLLHMVAATPEWQAQKLKDSLAGLDRGKTLPWSQAEVARENGLLADIAALGTAAAFQVMADGLRDPSPGHFNNAQGVYSQAFTWMPAAQREAARAALRSTMRDSAVPLSFSMISAWGGLQAPAPGEDPLWRQHQVDAWREGLAALAGKQPGPRAESAAVLSRAAPALVPEAEKASLNQALVSGFDLLPPTARLSALQNNWQQLRSPAMLPQLMALAHGSTEPMRQGRVVDAGTPLELHRLALERWYELDPAGATAEILQQIGTGSPKLSGDDLWYLPRSPMPQFESLWATALLGGEDKYGHTLATLLVRFGKGDAVAQVAEVAMRAGKFPCATADPAAVAYLVRFAPEATARRAVAAYTAAASQPHCGGFSLVRVGEYAKSAVMEEAAVSALQNDDAGQVRGGADYLARFGSEAARPALRAAFTRWAAKLAGVPMPAFGRMREEEMVAAEQFSALRNLRGAILFPQGWQASEDDYTLVTRCAVPSICTDSGARTAFSRPTISIFSLHSPVVSLTPFPGKTLEELEKKLKQLPRGTVIHLIATPPDKVQEDRVRALVKEAGLTVDR